MVKKKVYTFIDLFAGIGGFHQAMHSVGMKCVFASEWDKNARISYEANYKDIAPNLFENNNRYFNEDITKQDPSKIPSFDVCCGGFPCQPFSIAGLRRGFEDTRGTLFFNIANIVKNTALMDYLSNLSGLNIGESELDRAAKLYMYLMGKEITVGMKSNFWNRIDNGISNLMYKIYHKLGAVQ